MNRPAQILPPCAKLETPKGYFTFHRVSEPGTVSVPHVRVFRDGGGWRVA